MSHDSNRKYWDHRAKNYGRSMVFIGRPIPRMVELAIAVVSDADAPMNSLHDEPPEPWLLVYCKKDARGSTGIA